MLCKISQNSQENICAGISFFIKLNSRTPGPGDCSQPANTGPQSVLRTSRSNVLMTSPKDPIWPSRGRPRLTSWGRLEMTSKRHPNLTSKGLPWEVDSGRPQDVLRTSPRWPWKHVLGMMWGHLLDAPKFLFTYLSKLIRLTRFI